MGPTGPATPAVPERTGATAAAAASAVAPEPVPGVDGSLDAAVPAAPGRTTISETAVAKVAAVAARNVQGVYALGSGTARALSALRDAVGGSDIGQGVRVEVGQTQVAVDINLVAVYGVPLQQLANRVRAAVYAAVEEFVGLDVIEVNVEINDVHVPGLGDARSVTDRPVREASQP
ncbi:Asp23/Gls24 family envelope stress response protein [Arthrobacter mangrovi]